MEYDPKPEEESNRLSRILARHNSMDAILVDMLISLVLVGATVAFNLL